MEVLKFFFRLLLFVCFVCMIPSISSSAHTAVFVQLWSHNKRSDDDKYSKLQFLCNARTTRSRSGLNKI